jgi:hypothetical protein
MVNRMSGSATIVAKKLRNHRLYLRETGAVVPTRLVAHEFLMAETGRRRGQFEYVSIVATIAHRGLSP